MKFFLANLLFITSLFSAVCDETYYAQKVTMVEYKGNQLSNLSKGNPIDLGLNFDLIGTMPVLVSNKLYPPYQFITKFTSHCSAYESKPVEMVTRSNSQTTFQKKDTTLYTRFFTSANVNNVTRENYVFAKETATGGIDHSFAWDTVTQQFTAQLGVLLVLDSTFSNTGVFVNLGINGLPLQSYFDSTEIFDYAKSNFSSMVPSSTHRYYFELRYFTVTYSTQQTSPISTTLNRMKSKDVWNISPINNQNLSPFYTLQGKFQFPSQGGQKLGIVNQREIKKSEKN